MKKTGVKKGAGRWVFPLVLLGVFLAGAAMAVRGFLIEPFEMKTLVKSYSLKGLKEPFTAAFFTDTHFGKFYNEGNISRIAQAINAHNPRVIFFGGDLMDSYYRDKPNLDIIAKGLDSMNAPDGKFAVWGNHDQGGGGHRVYRDTLNAGGFQLLTNEAHYIESLGLWLGGLDDGVFGNPDTTLVNAFSPDEPGILLSHAPGWINELPEESAVDLMLSGHTHGGQVGLPILRYLAVQDKERSREFLKGDFTVNGTRLFVSCGIGTTKIPMRLFNTPEVVIINFVPAESGG